jgi:hypothetical protein
MAHRFTQSLPLEYQKRMTIGQRLSQFILRKMAVDFITGGPYSAFTRVRRISDKRSHCNPDSQDLVSGGTGT